MKDNKKRGRETFNRYRSIINILTKIISILPHIIRKKLFVVFRNSHGIIGIGIRYVLLKTLAEFVGDNVSIYPGCYLLNVEKMRFGNNVSIQPMCYMEAQGGIHIGNDVSIAHMVTIMSTDHQFDNTSINIKDQPVKSNIVSIGNNVWIGAKSTILRKATIGDNTIIGANSLVNKHLCNGVFVGAPAKLIKNI